MGKILESAVGVAWREEATGRPVIANTDATAVAFVEIVEVSDQLVAVGPVVDLWDAKGPLDREGIVLLGPLPGPTGMQP